MRARAIDWLRGGAAVVMVQTHALVLVRPELRKGALADVMAFFDGIVAPAFYACAGFALAFTLVGAARKGQVLKRALRILWRTSQVLAVSAGLMWMWFPIFREPKWLLRIDVLSVIGLSLLALLPLCAALARWPRALGAAMLALAAAIWLFAPALSHVRGPLAPFLGISAGSVFPPVPWTGHVAMGAGAGALLAHGVRPLWVWLGIAAGALALSQLCSQPSVHALFPDSDPWSEPSNQFQRALFVSAIALALTLLEMREPARNLLARGVEWYGTTSLSLYAIHEIWLYTSRLGFCFNDHWGGKLGWGGYVLATLALLGVSTLCVALIDKLEALAKGAASKLQGRNQGQPDAQVGRSA